MQSTKYCPNSSRLKRLRQRRAGRGQPSYIISNHRCLDLQAGGSEISRHCSQDTRRRMYQRGALCRSCRLVPMHLLNTVLPEGWEFSPIAEAAALCASCWRQKLLLEAATLTLKELEGVMARNRILPATRTCNHKCMRPKQRQQATLKSRHTAELKWHSCLTLILQPHRKDNNRYPRPCLHIHGNEFERRSGTQ